jgi:hypothetical protein
VGHLRRAVPDAAHTHDRAAGEERLDPKPEHDRCAGGQTGAARLLEHAVVVDRSGRRDLGSDLDRVGGVGAGRDERPQRIRREDRIDIEPAAVAVRPSAVVV